jgi:hypothetical protein
VGFYGNNINTNFGATVLGTDTNVIAKLRGRMERNIV